MCDSYCSDDPKDCDFRIETQTMEDEDTGELYADYHAVCQKCGRHESPWAMNDTAC